MRLKSILALFFGLLSVRYVSAAVVAPIGLVGNQYQLIFVTADGDHPDGLNDPNKLHEAYYNSFVTSEAALSAWPACCNLECRGFRRRGRKRKRPRQLARFITLLASLLPPQALSIPACSQLRWIRSIRKRRSANCLDRYRSFGQHDSQSAGRHCLPHHC